MPLHNDVHMTSSAEVAPTTRVTVAAAVIASTANDVRNALAARAVEGAAARYVVGGDAEVEKVAGDGGVVWVRSVPDLVGVLGPDVTHLWLLHDDARPRPDALNALVAATERLDASMVGSKILDASHPEMLESVGGATDVYGVPDTALVSDEMDQEQYDVVRDVAYVPGESVLIRRDLMRGLGGPDLTMPPVVRAIDFAQRARLAGGRVAVVPSSEVLHIRSCAQQLPGWRRVAGQWRAQIKVYGGLTLAWVIPFFLLIAVVDSVARTLMGRPGALFDLARAILWNLKHLGGTLKARRRARAVRQVGDEELFRYQLRGSVAMRRLGSDLTDWFRARDEGAVGSFIDRRRGFWQESGFFTGVLSLVAIFVAGRAVWFDRLPVSGFALTMPDPPAATLAAYAGGFNPSGFGSAQPMHPSVAATAVVQFVVGGDGRRTMWLISLAALVAGYLGLRRLLATLGVDGIPAAIGALAGVLGPAVAGGTRLGVWPILPAIAGVAWLMAGLVAPWPAGWRSRIGRVGVMVLAGGVAASYVPLSVVIPIGFAGVWSVFGYRSLRLPILAVVGATGGMLALAPWLWWVSIGTVARAGNALFWDVDWWVALAGAIVLLGSVIVGSRDSLPVIGTGGLLTIVGAWLARSAEVGSGYEPTAVGFVLAAVGTAIVIGGVFDMMSGLDGANVVRRGILRLVQLAGVALLLPVLVIVASGTVGLGEDRFGSTLDFTTARSEPHGPDRVLFVGEDLPGQVRLLDEIPYKVMSGGPVRMAEAWLARPTSGDRALEALLGSLLDEGRLRPGAELAGFGIRWVVMTSPTRLSEAFDATLDVKRLPLLDNPFAVYENLESAPRADSPDRPWSWTGFGYVGDPAESVRLAESSSTRWGPGSDGWAAVVDGEGGSADFAIDPTVRLLAWIALGSMAAALAAAAVSLGARR